MCTSRILFNHMPSTGLNSGKDGGCQRAANHERISMECCCNLLIFLSKLSETHKKSNSIIFGEVGLIKVIPGHPKCIFFQHEYGHVCQKFPCLRVQFLNLVLFQLFLSRFPNKNHLRRIVYGRQRIKNFIGFV